MPIMVMNPEMNSFRTLFRYSLEPEVYSFKLLDALIYEAERQGIMRYPIHVKIDSGMHRLGFTLEDMPRLSERLKSQTTVMARSVFSHFAGSDEPRFDAFSRQQIALFKECAVAVQSATPQPVMRHILNTSGIIPVYRRADGGRSFGDRSLRHFGLRDGYGLAYCLDVENYDFTN